MKRLLAGLALVAALLSGCAGAFGSDVSAPPAVTQDVQDYATSAGQITQAMGDSLNRVQTLMGNAQPDDPTWQQNLTKELAIWHQSYLQAQALRPPAKVAQAHATFLQAMSSYNAAANDLQAAIENQDASRFDAVKTELAAGSQQMAQAHQQLQAEAAG
ncbi:MAG TPA: hypothetical protein VFS62_07025 [Chloroflexota bacterium]|nr:hypothetical protein [Chloroflexota bacterium]